MVIKTVGRKSGRERETAITYVPYEGKWVVMPINAGSKTTPAWWLNLRAAGRGVVIVDGKRHDVVPRIAAGDERDTLWRRYVAQAPAMSTYERMAQREVPVVVLEPALKRDSAAPQPTHA